MTNMSQYNAALYLRISQEDTNKTEVKDSTSIETQRIKLMSFATKNRIPVYDVYCDDGFSGTNFNRPEFKRLIQDIKDMKVNCVIVKDLSRLGREYIKSGDILENFFPAHNVRFIALDDNIDRQPSLHDTDSHMLIPIYNLLNEFYPADISKKTRSALYAKAEKGEFLSAHVPYGYVRSSITKNFLIPDDRVKGIVEVIFGLIASGWSLSKVARFLHSHEIPNYRDLKDGTRLCSWTSQAVRTIIKNETYLGKVIYGKTKRISYKNSNTLSINESNWIVKEDTHQALVDTNLFEQANKKLQDRQRRIKSSSGHPFRDKLVCSDCGSPLNYCHEPRSNNDKEGYFVCRQNRRYGQAECSRHYIRLSLLIQAINTDLDYYYSILKTSRRRLYNKVLSEHERINYQRKIELEAQLDLSHIEERNLDEIFISIYQDKALRRITEVEYDLLYTEMNLKRVALKHKVDEYHSRLNEVRVQVQHIDLWIDNLLSYTDPPTVANMGSLIDKIEVFDREGTQQKIKVFYTNVGVLKDLVIDL